MGTGKFYDVTHIKPPTKLFALAGGTAGDHTVTGITTDDSLMGVVYANYATTGAISSAGDLISEFSITAANTINNAGGTNTTDMLLLVMYADYNA